MKKLIYLTTVFFSIFFINNNKSFSTETNNVVLEYCAGTWNPWQPCGDEKIRQILQDYPNTIVLGYHAVGSDPWQTYSSGISGMFGFNAYPSGVIGRRSGIVDRDSWNNEVALQTKLLQPDVSIQIISKFYSEVTRSFLVSLLITANTNLSGNYYLNYILTEDNLIYNQSGNTSCPGSPNYIHNHVVKSMINGDLGELINSGSWIAGQQITKNLYYNIPVAPQVQNVNNCNLNVLVYEQGNSFGNDNNIKQAIKTSLTGIISEPNIGLQIKVLFEGMYYPLFNQMSRRDTVTAYLHQSISPYLKIDSAKSVIDSISFSGLFNLFNAPSGNYYIAINQFNTIETWSKIGGENLVNNGSIYNYDFTSSINKAYGNNLKLKGSRYCLFSGDVNQDGVVDISDGSRILNDANNFAMGYLPTDLNGDRLVDISDALLADNNGFNYVGIISP